MTEHLDKAHATEQRLRNAITEAHGLLKDIRTERRALTDDQIRVQRLLDSIGQRVTDAMGEQIKTGLQEYDAAIKRAIDEATAATYRRFDTLASIMLGEDKPSKETIAGHVHRWRQALPDR